MNDLTAMMQADVKRLPNEEELSKIAELAQRQIALQRQTEILAEKLASVSLELKQVQEVQLPDALLSCGLSEVRTADGLKVTIKKVYAGSISEERKEAAFGWLREHGHDDLIKNEVTCKFGKGEDKEAEELTRELTELGVSYVQKKSVHPQTLGAFIREQVEAGADFPLETFGAYIGKKAVIK